MLQKNNNNAPCKLLLEHNILVNYHYSIVYSWQTSNVEIENDFKTLP